MNRLVTLAALAVFAAGATAGTGVAAAETEEHCVVEVRGQKADGELIVSEPACYGTFAEAMSHAAGSPSTGAEDGGAFQAAGTSGTIAVHYDGANFTGSSITISGSTCSGGWLNLTWDWRNRISSSVNYCPRTRFFDGLNLTGGSETMLSSGNLGTMNNRSESIQYLS